MAHSKTNRYQLTDQVCNVSKHPDNKKRHAESVGALALVVGDKLGELGRLAVSDRRGVRTQRLTITKIQATMLILPKMPEMASRSGKPCRASAAMAEGPGRGIMMVRNRESAQTSLGQRLRG